MKTGSPKGAGCTDVPPSQLLLVRSCRGGGGGEGEGDSSVEQAVCSVIRSDVKSGGRRKKRMEI